MPPESTDSISTVVVRRDAMSSVYAMTPHGIPDLLVTAMSPVAIIAVRMLRVYLQTAVGLVTTGSLMPAAAVLSDWRVALGVAVGPALVCGAQNAVELLARLDEKLPQMRP